MDRESLLKRLKNFFALVLKSFRQFSKDGEARFRLTVGMQVTAITCLTFILVVTALYSILAFDLLFFQSQGYPGAQEFTAIFYDFMTATLLEYFLYIGLSLIFVFLVGIYIGDLLLRPFRLIGDYCESFVNGKHTSYDPDFFSDLNLLARFSEYFFNAMENSFKQKQLPQLEVPLKYSRIHQPVFEKGFFLQFFLLILMISLSTGVLLIAMAVGVYEGVIDLAQNVIPSTNEVKYFLSAQSTIWETSLYVFMTIHFCAYLLLSLYLYSCVSAPAFGLFATMRAFLRGSYSNRVHLIGYYYIRPQCRLFNKYLDFMERELTRNDSSS